MKRRTLAHWAASRLSTSQVTMNPSRELGRCCRARFTDLALIMDYAQLSITRSSINTPWREMVKVKAHSAELHFRPPDHRPLWPVSKTTSAVPGLRRTNHRVFDPRFRRRELDPGP